MKANLKITIAALIGGILGAALFVFGPEALRAATPAQLGTTAVIIDATNYGQQLSVNTDGSINARPNVGTAIIGVATGTTGTVVGTLAATGAKTTYICGFDVSAIGGTAAVGPIVIAGLTGGSFTYQLASSAAGVSLSRTFTPCIPASAVNTTITITTTADGTASAVGVNSWGFQL